MLWITGQKDAKGRDIVHLSGTLITDPKPREWKSKNGAKQTKIELYISYGEYEDSKINMDCWFKVADVAKTLKRGDSVSGYCSFEFDKNGAPRTSMGSGATYDEPLLVMRKPERVWGTPKPASDAASHGSEKQEKAKNAEVDQQSFADLMNKGDLPF